MKKIFSSSSSVLMFIIVFFSFLVSYFLSFFLSLSLSFTLYYWCLFFAPSTFINIPEEIKKIFAFVWRQVSKQASWRNEEYEEKARKKLVSLFMSKLVFCHLFHHESPLRNRGIELVYTERSKGCLQGFFRLFQDWFELNIDHFKGQCWLWFWVWGWKERVQRSKK